MQVVEVGYCSDTRWRDRVAQKREQHEELITALRAAGWTVEEPHVIVLGVTGLKRCPISVLLTSYVTVGRLCSVLSPHRTPCVSRPFSTFPEVLALDVAVGGCTRC